MADKSWTPQEKDALAERLNAWIERTLQSLERTRSGIPVNNWVRQALRSTGLNNQQLTGVRQGSKRKPKFKPIPDDCFTAIEKFLDLEERVATPQLPEINVLQIAHPPRSIPARGAIKPATIKSKFEEEYVILLGKARLLRTKIRDLSRNQGFNPPVLSDDHPDFHFFPPAQDALKIFCESQIPPESIDIRGPGALKTLTNSLQQFLRKTPESNDNMIRIRYREISTFTEEAAELLTQMTRKR